MIFALLTSALVEAPTLARVTERIDELVLSGQSLPPDMILTVSRLPQPADRVLALVYLRRAGLLTGDPVEIGPLLERKSSPPADGANAASAAGAPGATPTRHGR